MSELEQPLIHNHEPAQSKITSQNDLPLKTFANLINEYREVAFKVPFEGSLVQKNKKEKNAQQIGQEFNQQDVYLAVYTLDKKWVFLFLESGEISQVNIQTKEEKKLKPYWNSESAREAAASDNALYVGFGDGNIEKYNMEKEQ